MADEGLHVRTLEGQEFFAHFELEQIDKSTKKGDLPGVAKRNKKKLLEKMKAAEKKALRAIKSGDDPADELADLAEAQTAAGMGGGGEEEIKHVDGLIRNANWLKVARFEGTEPVPGRLQATGADFVCRPQSSRHRLCALAGFEGTEPVPGRLQATGADFVCRRFLQYVWRSGGLEFVPTFGEMSGSLEVWEVGVMQSISGVQSS